MDRKTNTLQILNWWWEEDVQIEEEMEAALVKCYKGFKEFTGAENIDLAKQMKKTKSLSWFSEV